MKFHELLGAAFNTWYVECSNGLIALAKAGGDPDKVDWDEISRSQPVGWSAAYEGDELREVTVAWADAVLNGDSDAAGVFVDDPDSQEAWDTRPATREDAFAAVLAARDFFREGIWA